MVLTIVAADYIAVSGIEHVRSCQNMLWTIHKWS